MCLATVSDASHGHKSEFLDDWEEVEAFQSRCAKVLSISDERFGGSRSMQCPSGGVFKCCPEDGSELDHESIDISNRGCGRSIGPLRAGFVDVHGALDRLDWEVSAAAWWCQSVCCADCKRC